MKKTVINYRNGYCVIPLVSKPKMDWYVLLKAVGSKNAKQNLNIGQNIIRVKTSLNRYKLWIDPECGCEGNNDCLLELFIGFKKIDWVIIITVFV